MSPRRSASDESPAPFLKWAGGKSQLLAAYAPHLPAETDPYFEPFLGSGALYFHLVAGGRVRRARLSDTNEELVNAFLVVRDRVDELLRELARPTYVHDEEAYYAIRAWQPTALDPVTRAARLVYLNRTAFNGLYRVNSRGEFNVPFGRYDRPVIRDEPRLRRASAALARASIRCEPFTAVARHARRGSFVYFDPPYQPVSATSFTAYGPGGFTRGDQERLADLFAELDGRGVLVALSNADTEAVRSWYAGFPIVSVRARRAINSAGGSRGPVGEVLVLGRALAARRRRVRTEG
jgi:DNA adenine methylase